MANNQDDLDAVDDEIENQVDDSSDSEEEPATRAKKSGGILTKLVVLAVVLGGGFFVWQLGLVPGMKPAPKPPVQAQIAASDAGSAGQNMPSQEAVPVDILAAALPAPQDDILQVDDGIPVTAVSGDEANAPMDDILGQAPPPMPEDSPSVPVADFAPTPVESADTVAPLSALPQEGADIALNPPTVETAPLIVSDTGATGVEQPDPFAVADDIPAPAALGTEAPSLPEVVDTGIVDRPQTAPQTASATPDETLVRRLGEVEAKMAQVEKNLSDIRTSLENSSSSQVDSLLAEVEGLKSQLADLKVANTSYKKKQNKKSDPVSVAEREVSNFRQGVMPDVVRAVASDEPAPRHSKASTGSTKSRTASEMSPPAPSWTLRSAKPGMAWVSQSGARELKTVTIGDNLPGVGKITLISQDESGRWVVSGTKGFIRQ